MNLVPLNRVFIVGHGNKFDLNKMTQCAPTDEAVASSVDQGSEMVLLRLWKDWARKSHTKAG